MDRLKKFIQIVKQKGLDGFVVTNATNIFYLSGFGGLLSQDRESYLVFSPKATLTTARLYQAEAKELLSKNLNIAIAPEREEMLKLVAKHLSNKKRIGFEQNDLLFGEYLQLKKSTKGKLLPFENLIENLRIIKTADEIKKIEKAQIISQKAFDALLKTLKVGQSEAEIAHNLASIIRSLGGEGLAFESIIASGPNSGRPHHKTSNRRLSTSDILLMDFGAKFQNYHADLSRTIFVGKASDEHKNIYQLVLSAQQKAIKKINYGTIASDAYHASNNHFKKHKLDKYFLHDLGHGVGLAIHEEPYLRNLPTTNYQLLTDNMVFSVEPGLYFPWGGIRIEDLVTIKNGHAKVLGKLQEKIVEI